MDIASAYGQLRACPDRWRPGRYRVELAVQIACDAGDVGGVLDRLGYELVDVDQWGQSYQHKEDARRKGELDESEAPDSASLRLVLRHEDLDADEVGIAADGIRTVLDEIVYSQPDAGPGQGCRRA